MARRLAALALGLALLAVVLSGYAITMAFQHRDEVRSLGDVLHRIGAREAPLASPPAELDSDDR